jgi:hypothetical protein
MASILKVNSSVPTHHFALSRQFFIAWQQRNASRQARWRETPTDPGPALVTTASQLQFDSLHAKIQNLKSEIVSSLQQTPEISRACKWQNSSGTEIKRTYYEAMK